MLDLKGKWVLLTGATRGLGYLSAIELAKRGCNLILHSRSLEKSEKIAEEVRSLGVNAYAVPGLLLKSEILSDQNYMNSVRVS